MRRLWIPILFLAGCSPGDPEVAADATEQRIAPVLAGRLQERDIDEASGIARSLRSDNVFWVINDSGKPRLHAIDGRGADLGRVKVEGAKLSDWEDLASFRIGDDPYLLIADIGDNDANRKDVRVYVVAEPAVDDDEVEVAWQFDFTYPDGPLDAEAVAVDANAGRILVLSKREIPAVLYELPLRPETEGRQVAKPVAIPALPQPRRQDLEFAPRTKNWWWQPTAMDLADDGSGAVILTYRGVFYYPRRPDEAWDEALRRKPFALTTGDYDTAESVAFSADGRAVYFTFEGRRAPVVRIDLNKGTPRE
jgi:hypothetical protein